MRAYYFFAVIILIAGFSCTKEFKPSDQGSAQAGKLSEASSFPPLCVDDKWENAGPYHTYGLGMVYNNKIYVPDRADNKIWIYDGSGWTSKQSDIPFYTWVHTNNRDLVMFTIGNKGYMFIPYNPENSHVELIGFWEYNFATNDWRRRADFPGKRRDNPAYFTVGNKGYVVAGYQSFEPGPSHLKDTWEYDPASNSWSQKASLGYEGRYGAAGFSVGNKGYIVGGRLEDQGGPTYTKQLLEYDPGTNNWTKKTAFPGEKRHEICVFVLGNKAYAGCGKAYDQSLTFHKYEDFYQYTSATDSWVEVEGLPGISAVSSFYAFSINSFGYCVANVGSEAGTNIMFKYTPQYCP